MLKTKKNVTVLILEPKGVERASNCRSSPLLNFINEINTYVFSGVVKKTKISLKFISQNKQIEPCDDKI